MASENKKAKKISRVGYYSIIAFSLAVIGSVSWFTVSRLGALNSTDKSKNDKTPSYSSSNPSYNKNESKAEEKASEQGKSTDVANSAESVPYEEPKPEKPTFTMPVDGAVIKPFSNKTLQYSKTYGDMRLHEAIDLKCEENTAVKAAADGKITDVTEDSVFGKVITVDHGNGISVKYCGFNTVAVIKGSAVKGGDTLGTSGTVPCECKDEPHIHLEAADESGLGSILALFGISE